jgi:hypothetical protein
MITVTRLMDGRSGVMSQGSIKKVARIKVGSKWDSKIKGNASNL